MFHTYLGVFLTLKSVVDSTARPFTQPLTVATVQEGLRHDTFGLADMNPAKWYKVIDRYFILQTWNDDKQFGSILFGEDEGPTSVAVKLRFGDFPLTLEEACDTVNRYFGSTLTREALRQAEQQARKA